MSVIYPSERSFVQLGRNEEKSEQISRALNGIAAETTMIPQRRDERYARLLFLDA